MGEKIDNYDYSIVNHLIELMTTHFEDWNYRWEEKFIPHSEFKSLEKEDKCPCLSGKNYMECCAEEDGILMTYIEFWKEPTTNAQLKF